MSLFHRGAFTIESVRAHWNKVALGYDGWNKAYDTTHFQRFTEAMKHINLAPGIRVLDVWSRTGNASRYLFEIRSEPQRDTSCFPGDFVQ